MVRKYSTYILPFWLSHLNAFSVQWKILGRTSVFYKQVVKLPIYPLIGLGQRASVNWNWPCCLFCATLTIKSFSLSFLTAFFSHEGQKSMSMLAKCSVRKGFKVINRPGVAGAVLQTPSIRETVPQQTSDMGRKTISVLANSCLLS